ncbi:MAG: type II toxin-antitoxin system VapC family toxin [Micromonosporaceae bacterium]
MTAPAPPRFVVDASAVVALLADAGPAGTWVADTIRGGSLFAPELMPFEVANILRRHALAGILDASAATLAHADLVSLAVQLYPYAALADRVWALRHTLTAYDAAYVALAELLAAPVVTLDTRLGRAAGSSVLTYSAGA